MRDQPVLVLDEPTDGLDPNQKHEMRALLATMAPHKAIVISTHILEEVDAICTRAIIIAAGRVVADATPAELRGEASFRGSSTTCSASSRNARPLDVDGAIAPPHPGPLPPGGEGEGKALSPA